MSRKCHFSFTKITTDELFVWLKDKLDKGFFPEFKNLTDDGIMKLAMICKPLISSKLDVAEKLAIIQLDERSNRTEKPTLESDQRRLKTSRDISNAQS